jgi:hypothetical protein
VNLIAIERFYPMISSNILPNIISILLFFAFGRKIAQNKTLPKTNLTLNDDGANLWRLDAFQGSWRMGKNDYSFKVFGAAR